jgi:hypothetical protein
MLQVAVLSFTFCKSLPEVLRLVDTSSRLPSWYLAVGQNYIGGGGCGLRRLRRRLWARIGCGGNSLIHRMQRLSSHAQKMRCLPIANAFNASGRWLAGGLADA